MKFAIKILIVTLFLTVTISSDCAAKIISDSTGRYSFDAPNNWQFFKAGTTSADNIELLSIRLDKDTGILFNQIKTDLPYKNFAAISVADRNQMKDAIIQQTLQEFKSYSLTLDEEKVYDDGIFLGFSAIKNGEGFALAELYFVKDYHMYFLFITGTPQTIVDAVTTALTLKVDGVNFSSWINS